MSICVRLEPRTLILTQENSTVSNRCSSSSEYSSNEWEHDANGRTSSISTSSDAEVTKIGEMLARLVGEVADVVIALFGGEWTMDWADEADS